MNDEEIRQEVLQKLLGKELKRLKRYCFPYKHRKFLQCDVEIVESNELDDDEDKSTNRTTLGSYQTIEGEKEYECSHKISISSKILSDYIIAGRCQDFYSRYRRRQVVNTVRHEVVHAFCYERYHDMFSIKNQHHDASPIFLSVLYWCKGLSHYNFVEAFKNSKFWEDITKINTFKDLDDYIFNTLIQYKNVIRKIEKFDNTKEYIKNKNLDLVTFYNNFSFANRNASLIKSTEAKEVNKIFAKDEEVKKANFIMKVTNWEIGCAITPKMLEELYYKKQDNTAINFSLTNKILSCKKTNEEVRTKVLKETEISNIKN